MRTILKFLPMMALVGCMAVSCDDDNDYDFGDGTEIPTDTIPNPDVGDGTGNGGGDYALGNIIGDSQYGEIYYNADDTDFSSPQLRFRGSTPEGSIEQMDTLSAWVTIDIEIEPYTKDITGTYTLSTDGQAGTFSNSNFNMVTGWELNASSGMFVESEWLHSDVESCSEFTISIEEYDGESYYKIVFDGEGSPSWGTYDLETAETTYAPAPDQSSRITFYYDGSLATVIGD